jgi:dihydroflavonol-4-reductase
MNNTSVLVTGATGFVGAYLLRHLLSKGYTNLRGLRQQNSPMALVEPFATQVEWVVGDLLDIFSLEDAFNDIQQVYHCAAMVSFAPSDRRKMMMINEQGTANVVNTALEKGIQKLVHVSSIAAIGRSKEGEIINETNKWERSSFNTNYAISKFKAEQEVWRGVAEGLTAAIVNPSIILGSSRWGTGTAKIFELIANGYAFYPAGTTGLVDIRDVVRFMVLLMESNIQGERYILNGEHLSYKDLLTQIAQAFNKKPPYIKVNPFLRGLAWRLAWLQAKISGQKPVLTKETANNSSRVFYYDHTKSVEHFDFNYTPIAQTIRETAEQLSVSASSGQAAMMLPEIA